MFSNIRGHQQRNRLIIAACVSCLLLAVFFVSLYSPPHDNATDRDLLSRDSISFASLEGLSLEEKSDNEISFRINAEKAHVKNRKAGFFRVAVQKVVEMENVTVRSKNETDAGFIEIRSDRATMYLGSKDILFKGNVTFSSEDGATLKTGQLMWDKKRNRFRADSEYVYINSDGLIQKGTGFESDNTFKIINFKNTYKSLSRGEKSNHG